MILEDLLRFAERDTGYSVSIETLHPAFGARPALVPAAEQRLHHARFCRERKLGAFGVCQRNKKQSLSIARHGRIFAGFCPRGWWEMAFPFLFRGELAAVIYFGGERPPEPDQKKNLYALGRFVLEFLRIEWELADRENALGTSVPSQRGRSFPQRERVLYYLDRSYTRSASLKELADLLHLHAGYLGECIRKEFGKTFRALLTEKRVAEAKVYLRLHRSVSVAKTAALCGFPDSNYFSLVFRKTTGRTPGEYRASVSPDRLT